MTNDTTLAAEPVATEEDSHSESTQLSKDDLVALMTAQNLALVESVKELAAALRGKRLTKIVEARLAKAEKAAGFAFRKVDGQPDLTPLAQVLGSGNGWRVKKAIDDAFKKVLEQELAAALPTVAEISVENEVENGDEGQSYFSFDGMTVTFKDGQTLYLGRDFHADMGEFVVSDDDELIRRACDGNLDEEEKEDLNQVVASYAALFGVEPTAENVKDCFDTLGGYVEDYYNHYDRDGGLDVVYSA